LSLFVSAIIAAGGRGERLGGARPKQLLAVADREILDRSVSTFVRHPRVQQIVVALPAELVADPPAYLIGQAKPIAIVAGGARRQESVANGFAAADSRADVILIHDAARPFASPALIDRTIDAACQVGAALAAVQAHDTVKHARRDGVVGRTIPREEIFLAQTPQGFRREVLRDALALAEREHIEATDEAALAERAGHRVQLVEGESTNIKITTADDLPIAEAIARSIEAFPREGRPAEGFAPQPEMLVDRHANVAVARVGTGYDLHRLVEGRPLVLGGITLPSQRGALGHSDADVVCHAATDAVLGAAAAGDIGRHFPDSDPQWKDASSLDLLARAAAIARGAGLEVGNLDVTVLLESPKIEQHIDAMRSAVARALGVDEAQVSIKGKTNEGVDAVGRGEAIAAHAVALLRSR
jgi:2-C-methyl-D-erythritol 4-phosphate cytidylyltransferase / 2-C-methyl-D-erythritol 2,4-cyclodiphosphate synthase